MFPKAQFLSFCFLWWVFRSHLMSQMSQVGVGATALRRPRRASKWKWLILVYGKGKNYIHLHVKSCERNQNHVKQTTVSKYNKMYLHYMNSLESGLQSIGWKRKEGTLPLRITICGSVWSDHWHQDWGCSYIRWTCRHANGQGSEKMTSGAALCPTYPQSQWQTVILFLSIDRAKN